MENLYVTFKVDVADHEYLYEARRGSAEVKIQIPRTILESIDPGNLFVGALHAALANFDTFEEEQE